MTDIILLLLIIWNIGLSSVLLAVIKCQNNQSELLYTLRDDLNKAKICDGYVLEHIPEGDGDLKIDLSNCPNIHQKMGAYYKK